MSCDSTDQRRSRAHATVGAAELKDQQTCICDCSVVKAASSAPKASGHDAAPRNAGKKMSLG